MDSTANKIQKHTVEYGFALSI